MNAAFRGTGPNASWNTEAPYLSGERTNEAALLRDLASKPNALFLVASETTASPILGCVWLEPRSADTWYLGSLTIDPTLQNSGLGRQLLAAAEQSALHHGAAKIQMTVINVRDTLIAWYQRRGYHLTGEVRPFPYGDNRFGTPLRDDLTFVVLEKSLTPSTPPNEPS
jgi:ribosomal protein S18 acetylase RimI-like enzyme